MNRAMQIVKQFARLFWRGLREWSGDAAYDRYLACARRTARGGLLSPTEFYVEELNRKYSRPNRCC
jgi:Selenoprotein, putative